jgi:hypothetical protein
MRMNKLLVPLVFSMFFGSGLAVAASDITWDEISEIKTEPTLCYEASMLVFESMGLENASMAIALDLCTGARDAKMVIGCLLKSTASVEEGGLEIPFPFALEFCKQNG